MKTFTLRLTDNEAEALNRMAACYGMSKNQIITALIEDNYSNNLLGFGESPDAATTEFLYFDKHPLYFIEQLQACFEVKQANEEFKIPFKECVKRMIAVYDYVLEKSGDDLINRDELMASRNEFLKQAALNEDLRLIKNRQNQNQ